MGTPFLPLRDCAVLPGCRRELSVGRPGTLALLEQVGIGGVFVAGPQRIAAAAFPRRLSQLYPHAATVRLVDRWTTPAGQDRVRLEGLQRVRLEALRPRMTQLSALVVPEPADVTLDAEEAALALLAQHPELGAAPDGRRALYVLADVLGDREAGPLLLEAQDLDSVLGEVMDALDRLQGVGWLQ